MNMTFRILIAAVFLTIAGVAIAGVNGSPNRRDAAMVLPVAVTPDGGLIELRVDSAGALAVTSTGSSTFSGAVAATQSGAWAVTSTGTSTVSGTVAATQSGSWAVSQAATSTAWTVDATAMLREFACWCAERALKRAKVTDPRSWEAIRVARAFARGEATAEQLRDARNAAYAAAYAADAADAAAYAAAYAAAARKKLQLKILSYGMKLLKGGNT